MATAASAYFSTSASASTSDLPSIFHLIACDGLAKAVRPAVQQLLRFAADRYPEKLGFLRRYCDELYLLVDLVVQHHHLSRYNALFAENFYGLERAVVGGSAPTTSWLKYSLVFSVLLPYAKVISI